MNELIEIITSPGHWAFEGISDLAFALPAYAIGRWRLRAHDAKKHGGES